VLGQNATHWDIYSLWRWKGNDENLTLAVCGVGLLFLILLLGIIAMMVRNRTRSQAIKLARLRTVGLYQRAGWDFGWAGSFSSILVMRTDILRTFFSIPYSRILIHIPTLVVGCTAAYTFLFNSFFPLCQTMEGQVDLGPLGMDWEERKRVGQQFALRHAGGRGVGSVD